MNIKKKNTCPNIYLLEAFANKQHISPAADNLISNHLLSCPRCNALASELKQFYDIFIQESMLPVSSSVFKMINQIEADRVAITAILLRPLEPLNGHISMAFQSKIVFSNQNFDQKNLADINSVPVKNSEILIRVVQSLITQETTCYLFSHIKKLYSNIKLQLDSTQNRYKSDCCGKIKLGKFDIRSLDNKVITVTVEK